jgi:hypothetical protein
MTALSHALSFFIRLALTIHDSFHSYTHAPQYYVQFCIIKTLATHRITSHHIKSSKYLQHIKSHQITSNHTQRWKLSPMDIESRNRWVEYSKAKDEMLRNTDTDKAPWIHVHADSKKLARLNCISHLLSLIPYQVSSVKICFVFLLLLFCVCGHLKSSILTVMVFDCYDRFFPHYFTSIGCIIFIH